MCNTNGPHLYAPYVLLYIENSLHCIILIDIERFYLLLCIKYNLGAMGYIHAQPMCYKLGFHDCAQIRMKLDTKIKYKIRSCDANLKENAYVDYLSLFFSSFLRVFM